MKYLLFVLGLSILFYACKKNPVSPQKLDEVNEIVPLSVGNFWQGLEETFDQNGQTLTKNNYKISIISKGDKPNSFILQKQDGSKYTSVITDSGLIFYFSYDPKLEPDHYLQFKYPAGNGDMYRIDKSGFRKIISSDTTITTQFGRFQCIHYKLIYDGILSHWDDYISPGHGFIYSEYYQHQNSTGITYLQSRTSYQPNILPKK